MDFFDSHDLDAPKHKKSRQVRSWYLYEQFKSLERNQLDAARKLKNRSYQDRILQQELSERKARRKVYDHLGLTQSESGMGRSLNSESTRTSLNVSTDDVFESYHELHEDEDLAKLAVHDFLDVCSQDNSQTGTYYEVDYKSAEEHQDKPSSVGSVNSVLNVTSRETLTEDIKKLLEIEKETKFDEIELSFDEVKEKLQCLERLSQLKDFDTFSESEDIKYLMEEDEKQVIMKDKTVNTPDVNVYFMWSKLVSFAYQIMQLNHGNCYYDYGSQFLTAVLACDVLRRGLGRMCRILQPYVSPIKFAIDMRPKEIHKKDKINKKREQSTRTSNFMRRYPYYTTKPKTKLQGLRNYWSESYKARYSSQFSVDSKTNWNKIRCNSNPVQSITPFSPLVYKKNLTPSDPSYQSIWPISSNCDSWTQNSFVDNCSCCRKAIVNPMLRLSEHLDRIMRDIEDPLFS